LFSECMRFRSRCALKNLLVFTVDFITQCGKFNWEKPFA
jgi:hypothetical protein